jgi:hypothetical protein
MTDRLAFLILCLLAPQASARTFEVGPGQPFEAIGEVPWERLQAGDTVRIHWRPEPYREKWSIGAEGTETAPVHVLGVPNEKGDLPVIEGRDAVTRPELDCPGGPRSVIRVGSFNAKSADQTVVPRHVVIENLEIRGARPPNRFTGKDGETPYLKHAAGIHIAEGFAVTVRGCVIHDCGNGLMSGGSETLVEGCHIFGNGNPGSLYEHNIYTSGSGMIFQGNRLGPLRKGCPGNNLKDRSAGLVVRCNWIEGGNRQLDLVDANEHHAPLTREPRYRETIVFGNVLIEPASEGNSQIVHYGGDSGQEEFYRNGTLRFYHNTVLSFRKDQTTLFRLAGSGGTVDCRNNLVWLANPDAQLQLGTGQGRLLIAGNWLPERCSPGPGAPKSPEITGLSSSRHGRDPGFLDPVRFDFRLPRTGSAAHGTALSLPDNFLKAHAPDFQYEVHQRRTARPPETWHLPGALVQIGD